MAFSGDLVLHTHMRMNGSWHIYRPGERWQRPARDMRVLVGTDAFVAVGFNVPVAEFLTGRELERHRAAPGARTRPARSGVRSRRSDRGACARTTTTTIADVLLNQRVMCRHRQRVQVRDPVHRRHPSVRAGRRRCRDEALDRMLDIGADAADGDERRRRRRRMTRAFGRRTTGSLDPAEASGSTDGPASRAASAARDRARARPAPMRG